MADKINYLPPAVDVNAPNASQSPTTPLNPYSTCSCTKIGTMQLFHEMKQEFPTVPDDIVCKYVMDNCHNRPACIEGLRLQAEEYPGSVNAYPAALRQQPNKKQTFSSRRPSPSAVGYSAANESISLSTAIPSRPQGQPALGNAAANGTKPNENQSSDSRLTEKYEQPQNPSNHLQRPRTLNLTNLDACTRGNRPTRMAPPPPASMQEGYIPTSTEPRADTPLNVSLNVIVSPVSGRPPLRPTRIAPVLGGTPTSESNIGCCGGAYDDAGHHHHHFHRPVQSINPGSFRSVSFTLHQPNSGPSTSQQSGGGPQQSVNVNESGGPSLKYSSRSYDAKIGYQSRLEITVGGNGGVGSSSGGSRTHPNSCSSMPVIASDTYDRNAHTSTSDSNPTIRSGVSMPNVMASSGFLEEADTVHHQLLCKQRLVIELENEKKRLEVMQRELHAIVAPLPEGGSNALSEEIELLQINCKQMALEVEEAGPSYALGETNEAFYKNIYTGQRLPIQQYRATGGRQQAPPPIPAALRSNLHRPPSSDASTSQNPHYQTDDQLEVQGGWICDMCTFQNHPLLKTCEQCEFPLFSAGTHSLPAGPSPSNGFAPVDPYVPQTYLTPASTIVQYQPQTRIHIPYQKQAAVTVGTANRLPPIVYAYTTPPPPRLTQQH